jgi:ketosteroid isomerase-like protein
MRYFTCVLVALCISAGMLYAQDAQKLSPAEQEVIKVNQVRLDAFNKRDLKTWSHYVADDCIFSDDDGALTTKAGMMEGFKMPHDYDYGTNNGQSLVHVYGTTAVINFRATIHEKFGSADIVSEQRYTATYAKQNGAWLLVAEQWGNLPVNFRKPVAIDASAYKDYVGQYQARPLDDVDIVSVKDGKLWSQIGKDEEEYLPLSSDAFFVKDDLGSVTFSRDPQGHVTGYTYHRVDGQEIHDKKIK